MAHPKIRKSELWVATMTPLASIIGSGFLVVVPLLAFTVGRWAAPAMLALVLIAYGAGSAMRLWGLPKLDHTRVGISLAPAARRNDNTTRVYHTVF